MREGEARGRRRRRKPPLNLFLDPSLKCSYEFKSTQVGLSVHERALHTVSFLKKKTKIGNSLLPWYTAISLVYTVLSVNAKTSKFWLWVPLRSFTWILALPPHAYLLQVLYIHCLKPEMAKTCTRHGLNLANISFRGRQFGAVRFQRNFEHYTLHTS
jgi:hypothetical protein